MVLQQSIPDNINDYAADYSLWMSAGGLCHVFMRFVTKITFVLLLV